VQSDAPLQVAGGRAGNERNDPGLSLVRVMSSAGVMKAALREQSALDGASGRYTLIQR